MGLLAGAAHAAWLRLTQSGMQTKQQQLQAEDDARTAKNRSKRLKRKVCA